MSEQGAFLLVIRVPCLLLLGLPMGCQSGVPEYVLFNDDRDVIAYADSKYPTVYAADKKGIVAVGQGNAYLSVDGRYLVLLDHDRKDGYSYLEGERIVIHHVPTRRSFTTRLPVSFIDHDLKMMIAEGPQLYIAIRHSGERQMSWSPWAGWGLAKIPESLQVVPMRSSLDSKSKYDHGIRHGLSNPIVLKPDAWNARRTVWVRPNGETQELLRQNDVPLKVSELVALSPVILVPGSNLFYLLAWSEVLAPLSPRDGDSDQEDLEQLRQGVRQGILFPPADEHLSERREPFMNDDKSGEVPE